MDEPDLSLIEGTNTVPLGVSLAYVLVVDYRNMFPRVSLNLQITCNDGEQITVLP